MSETNTVHPSPKDETTVPKAYIEHKHGESFVEKFHHIRREDGSADNTLHVYYEENAPGLQEAERCELYYEIFYEATIASMIFEPPNLKCELSD